MDGLQLRYFVLSPTSKDVAHAHASRAAMLHFADVIESSNPKWAADVRKWVKDAEEATLVRERNNAMLSHAIGQSDEENV